MRGRMTPSLIRIAEAVHRGEHIAEGMRVKRNCPPLGSSGTLVTCSKHAKKSRVSDDSPKTSQIPRQGISLCLRLDSSFLKAGICSLANHWFALLQNLPP